MLQKMIQTTLFSVGLCWSAVSFASNVLILATDEPYQDFNSAIQNAKIEFENAGATVTVNTKELSNGTAMNPSIFTPGGVAYDVVVVLSAYNPIDSADWPVINTAIEKRTVNAFLLFVDSCCQYASNGNQATSALSAASGWTLGVGGFEGEATLPLNTGSPYRGSFSGMSSGIMGHTFNYITGVPADNALFLPVHSSPVSGQTPVSAYGAILPTTQSYSGRGACVQPLTSMPLLIRLTWVESITLAKEK